MEIGLLGLDGIQGSGNGLGSVFADGEASKQKWASRNEGFKQERFGFCGDDDCRVSKLARTGADFSPDSSFVMLQNSGGFVEKSTSTASAVSSDADKLRFFCHSIPENSALPYFHHMADAHTKNAGLSASSGVYLVSGVRGPFTASQWLELEQQALIYKYMKENEPIPLHLLFPIVKAFESAGLFGFNGGTFRPTSWGMGPFHLGYSRSTDPEPGRCRRTDGKKWRCSKEAVASQKYCERHMNRGRHRSRKHVEGQANGNGSSAPGADKSSTTKLMPPSPSNNSFAINQNQYQRNAFVDRTVGGGEKSEQGVQQASWRGSSFSASKYQTQCGELGMHGGGPCQLMGAADFMSPAHLDMGLGLGSYGPLGEALQSSTG